MTMELVQTIELGSNVTSLEFTNIPNDGSDIKILISARDTGANATLEMTFNNVTANYKGQRMRGNGSSVTSTYWSAASGMYFDYPSSSAGTSNRGSAEIYITDPSRTGSAFGNKVVSINTITEKDSTVSYQGMYAWRAGDTSLKNSAITSIKFTNNIFSGSTFTLYKITSA